MYPSLFLLGSPVILLIELSYSLFQISATCAFQRLWKSGKGEGRSYVISLFGFH